MAGNHRRANDGKEYNDIPVVVVIPALNPNQTTVKLAAEIKAVFAPRIVVINDGSDEINTGVFESLESMGCDILTHTRNLGKGAALKTGFKHVIANYPDSRIIVTVDADGQHAPKDIFHVAKRLDEGADGIVLGTRSLHDRRVPFKSKWGNKITSLVFWLITGIRLRDTQTGLRAFPMRYLPAVLQVKGTRYEYETNMLLHAHKTNIPIMTISIDTIYSDNNTSSNFHAVQDSARIYWHLLKFGISSVICAALDFGLFIILLSFIFNQHSLGITVSAVLARIVSGACNFLINRYIVFKGKGRSAVIKYSLLFFTQMFLSACFTTILVQGMPPQGLMAQGILAQGMPAQNMPAQGMQAQDMPTQGMPTQGILAQGVLAAPIAKLVVDSVLFVLSFIVQRKLIFKKEGGDNENAAE
ncbi:MAG: bifunctional glycosyltransferase family 2/GtrA family protein [Oscillospiraceae bacterium]|nr:bifunctional glycosyltransferase family 2/GtrA family protein [Oscillospiraceae bacterium]